VASQDPPYETSRAYQLVSVPTTVLLDRAGTIAGTVTGWDHAGLAALIGRAEALLGTELLIPEATEPLVKPGCSSKAAMDPELAAAISAPAGTDDVEEMFERGWTDGLPVVPPTPERVEAMLGGCDGQVSLGLVPPGMGEATLERVAACAVLAGCRPAYFPVVVAAAQAALDPAFNLHGQAVTTQPAGQLVIVNGPVRETIGLNSGMGALGPGFRANLTIGRALRLLVTLTGGAVPGGMDRATQGHMGKIGFCVAEDEETSPWEPLHVERGFQAGQSVVTVIGSDAPLSISDHRSRTPEDLAWVLAWAAASAWSTNWWPLDEPSVFVICPEHAEMFRAAGWTKQRLRHFMFEAVRKPAAELRRGETTPVVHAADPGALGDRHRRIKAQVEPAVHRLGRVVVPEPGIARLAGIIRPGLVGRIDGPARPAPAPAALQDQDFVSLLRQPASRDGPAEPAADDDRVVILRHRTFPPIMRRRTHRRKAGSAPSGPDPGSIPPVPWVRRSP